ncbi:hypothetical protein BH24CHL6_BH24CHL6_00930 [soil metagenome]
MRRFLLLLASMLIASCTAAPAPAEETASASPSPAVSPSAQDPTRPPTGTPPISTVPPTPAPVVGEVPTEILAAVVDEAAALAGVSAGEVEVLRAEQVIWSDGSLGCPVPGTNYTQEPVDGYWVELRAGEETFDFRLGSTGVAQLCEQARPSSDDRVPDY